MEFAGTQLAHLRAIELGQCGQHHGMNGHVDADTQRVSAADHRKKTLLGELLDQTAIAGKHARMVDTHAGTQQTLQNLTERVVNFVPLIASAMAARCSLLDTPVLARAFAVSNAAS